MQISTSRFLHATGYMKHSELDYWARVELRWCYLCCWCFVCAHREWQNKKRRPRLTDSCVCVRALVLGLRLWPLWVQTLLRIISRCRHTHTGSRFYCSRTGRTYLSCRRLRVGALAAGLRPSPVVRIRTQATQEARRSAGRCRQVLGLLSSLPYRECLHGAAESQCHAWRALALSQGYGGHVCTGQMRGKFRVSLS